MSNHLTPEELDCLRSVKHAADELGLPIIAVGASTRQLVFDWPHGIPIRRSTTDWDFGVQVPDWPTFFELRAKLIQQMDSFQPGKYEHELVHQKTGTKVDLVPFGGLETDGRIRWPESAKEMNVFGFSEAYENASHLELEPGLLLPVATIQLQIALKFFAFADRKDTTDRDLSDLWHVVQCYVLTSREAELVEGPLAVLADENFNWDYLAVLLMGYDVGRACKPATIARLLAILEPLTDPYSKDIRSLISRWPSEEEEEEERRRVSESFYWLLKAVQFTQL